MSVTACCATLAMKLAACRPRPQQSNERADSSDEPDHVQQGKCVAAHGVGDATGTEWTGAKPHYHSMTIASAAERQEGRNRFLLVKSAG